MGFKEKLNSAADFAQKTTKAVKNTYESAGKAFDHTRDFAQGLKVDIKAAAEDKKFLEYLSDVHEGKIDATNKADSAKIREAYIKYQRAEDLTKRYTELFDQKLSGLINNPKEKLGTDTEKKKKDKREIGFRPTTAPKSLDTPSFDGKNHSRLNVTGKKKESIAPEQSTDIESELKENIVKEENTKPEDKDKSGPGPKMANVRHDTEIIDYKKVTAEELGPKKEKQETAPGDYKSEIAAYIREMAKNNPEQLRKLENKLAKVEKNEKDIKVKQEIIDKFKAVGGKKGLENKLNNLKMANSLKRNILHKTKLDHWFGQKEKLAYEKVQKEYGLGSATAIRFEIEKITKNIKTVEEAESQKNKIKDRFSKLRSEIYLDNDIAKKVHERTKEVITAKIASLKDLESIESLQEGKKFIEDLKEKFGQEGQKEARNYFGTVKEKTVKHENMPIDMNKEEFEQLEKEMESLLEKKLSADITKLITKTESTELDKTITKYLKQVEFAGKTKSEAVKKVYEIFIKLMNNLKIPQDKKMMLSFALNRAEYLTI